MCSTVHVCLWANEWASVVHIARHIDKLGLLSAPFHFTPFSFRQHFCYQFDSDSFVQVYISMWWQPTCIVIKVATFLSRQMFKLKQHTFKKNSFAYFISSNSIFFLQFHLFFLWLFLFSFLIYFAQFSYHVQTHSLTWQKQQKQEEKKIKKERPTENRARSKFSQAIQQTNLIGLVWYCSVEVPLLPDKRKIDSIDQNSKHFHLFYFIFSICCRPATTVLREEYTLHIILSTCKLIRILKKKRSKQPESMTKYKCINIYS